MPAISLCMITKDEEEFLEQCLDSVKGLVDEIIIVDTGSKDKTKEIAKKFNAKVYEVPWKNDFSKARNESLAYARKDWILVLDADETISRKDHERIKELVKSKESTGFMLIQRSYTDDSSSIKWVSSEGDGYEESKPYSGWVYSGITRLFGNDPRIRFEYPVHETVKESIKRINGKIVSTDIPIHHYGKVRSNVDEKSKMYLEIGKEKLKSAPKAKFHYELGIQAMVLKKYDEAVENLKKAIELNPVWVAPYVSLGNIYCTQKKYDEAVEILKKGTEIEDNSDAYNNLGVAYEKLERFQDALEEYKISIKINPRNAEAFQNIARLMLRFKRLDKAIVALERVVKLKPNDVNNYHNLGGIYMQIYKYKEALETLRKALEIEPNNPVTLTNIASLFIAIKKYSEALDFLKKAQGLSPEDEQIKKSIEKVQKLVL